jgi:hypothetical protein
MNYIFTSGTYLIQNDIDWDKVNYNNVYIVCDTSSAPVNIILPEITDTPYLYTRFLISDRSNNASVNNITISTSGSDLINGNATSIVINTNNGSVICFQICANINIQGGAPISSKWVALQSNQSGGGGGGGFTTADNGLTANTATNVRLGGTLIQNTTITASTFDFIFTGAKPSKNQFTLDVQNTSTGSAIRAQSNNGVGSAIRAIALDDTIVSQSTNGSPFVGYTLNGDAAVLQSDNGHGIIMESYLNSVLTLLGGTGTSIEPILTLKKQNNIVGSIGNGLSIDIYAGLNNISGSVLTSKIASVYENVTNLNESASLDFITIGSGTLSRKMSINGDGKIIFDKYGTNVFTGTPTKTLSVDASGNVIETDTTGVNLTDTGFIFPTTPI